MNSSVNKTFYTFSTESELNQNQNSKQLGRPDTIWKLYFTLKINEQLS